MGKSKTSKPSGNAGRQGKADASGGGGLLAAFARGAADATPGGKKKDEPAFKRRSTGPRQSSEPRVPKIILTQEVDDFMQEVAHICDGEVGGQGYAYVDPTGNIVVDEVFLVPQYVSSGSVDFTQEAIAVAIEKAIEDDRIDDLRFSWHSHGGLGVFWSSTDEGGIRKLMQGGTPWLASMVVNHRGEYVARIDRAGAGGLDAAKQDTTVEVVHRDRTDGRAAAEVAKHVTEVPIYGAGVRVAGSGKRGGAISRAEVENPELDAICGDAGDLEAAFSEAGFHILDPQFEAGDGGGLIVGKNGELHDMTPREVQRLEDAGCDPGQMTSDEILDKMIELDLSDMEESIAGRGQD